MSEGESQKSQKTFHSHLRQSLKERIIPESDPQMELSIKRAMNTNTMSTFK